MDSITTAQSLLFLAVFIFVSIQIHVVCAQKFDSLTQNVTFYPGSLLISHSPKPLTFYEDTKLCNVHTVFNFTEFLFSSYGKVLRPAFANNSQFSKSYS